MRTSAQRKPAKPAPITAMWGFSGVSRRPRSGALGWNAARRSREQSRRSFFIRNRSPLTTQAALVWLLPSILVIWKICVAKDIWYSRAECRTTLPRVLRLFWLSLKDSRTTYEPEEVPGCGVGEAPTVERKHQQHTLSAASIPTHASGEGLTDASPISTLLRALRCRGVKILSLVAALAALDSHSGPPCAAAPGGQGNGSRVLHAARCGSSLPLPMVTSRKDSVRKALGLGGVDDCLISRPQESQWCSGLWRA